MREQLKEVFRNVLEVDSVPEDASTASIPSWDSVRHLSLILAIEEHFGITFETSEIPELISFEAIAAKLERHANQVAAG